MLLVAALAPGKIKHLSCFGLGNLGHLLFVPEMYSIKEVRSGQLYLSGGDSLEDMPHEAKLLWFKHSLGSNPSGSTCFFSDLIFYREPREKNIARCTKPYNTLL